MKNIKLLAFLVLFLTTLGASAQDIHFSQFYLSPLNLNPALTGVMNCNSRLTANFRNQWAAVLRSNAYNTYAASYDQRIPVGRYDYVGVGGSLWGDRAGSSPYSQLSAKISASYSKRMGGYRKQANYLVVGIDVGVGQRSVDPSIFRWGSQNNGGVYDPTKPTLETFNQDNVIFPDLSAGLLWFNTIDEDNNFYVGGAYHHLNRANIAFSDKKPDLLYSRFTVHGGGEFMIGDKWGLVPNVVLLLQGPSMELNPGTSVKFLLGKSRYNRQAFHVGVWGRIAHKKDKGQLLDAAILTTRFDYNNVTLGFSYDMNTSALRVASPTNSSFEFSMQYKICGNERRNVYCPNF
jgi:type IX secretion system PorP/SprF family membrane protein